MRLLILSDGLTFARDDAYYAEDAFLHYVKYLEPHFEKIVACVPVAKTAAHKGLGAAVLDGGSIRVLETEPYYTVAGFYKRLVPLVMRNTKVLQQALDEADAVLMRLPAMNAFLLARLALKQGKPVFCYFVGDEKTIVKQSGGYRAAARWLAIAVASIHERAYRSIVNRSAATFFLSSDLKARFATDPERSFFTFTSLLTADDIVQRPRVEVSSNRRLLYVGRLSREKGLDLAISAVAELTKCGLDTQLEICGDGPHRTALEKLTVDLGLSNRISFSGFVSRGQALTERYRNSDVFVLPSLSEGVPKVLLEAMANGIPIVASAVGGIPDIIKDGCNGLLVPANDAQALATKVRCVLADEPLRRRLIQHGCDFVRTHTAEQQAGRIAEVVYSAVGQTAPRTITASAA